MLLVIELTGEVHDFCAGELWAASRLWKRFSARTSGPGEPSSLAAEVLGLPSAQRLERVIAAANDWDRRRPALPAQ